MNLSIPWLAPAIAVLVVIANGFGRRFAGGLLSQWLHRDLGTQVARLAQAVLVVASVAALAWWPGNLRPHMPAWQLIVVAIATWAGATWGFPGYSLRWPFMNFGVSRMQARNLVDTVGLSVNGLVACSGLALCAWAAGLSPWFMVLAGVARGPAWWAAAACVPDWRWLGFWQYADDQKRWIPMPTAVAEFYSGMALGAGICLTIAGA